MSGKKNLYYLATALFAVSAIICVNFFNILPKSKLAVGNVPVIQKISSLIPSEESSVSAKPPNFLVVITDDQSWEHTSFEEYPAVKTPNFDRLANEGVYFENAYTSAPTCTAARSALLTGQHFWRLRSAAQLWGEFPTDLPTYQGILAQHGYKIGYTGKGWGPGRSTKGNPAGPAYNATTKSGADPNLSQPNHVVNFKKFLDERKPGQPFSFWVSPTEPHRPFQTGIGLTSGEIDAAKIVIPPFMPDVPEVRSDIADYLYEIQYFDRELGEILKLLQENGELENTLIIYTSDNGMAFPRAKSNNYEYGTRVPFAARWGANIKKPEVVTDFVSLTDIAPTFLDLAGIPIPAEMTGRSLRKQLLAGEPGRIDKARDAAYTGFERHIRDARFKNHGYPSRAIHTDKYTYIQNFTPDRWPAGKPPGMLDIDDGSPSKDILQQRDKYGVFLELAAGKRPEEELYARDRDQAELNNLAQDPEYQSIKAALQQRLLEEMKKSGDPWAEGNGQVFDSYIYYAKEYL